MLQVRGKIYRDKDGFTVCGRDHKGRKLAIFVKHLSTALAIKAVCNNKQLADAERDRLVDSLITGEC